MYNQIKKMTNTQRRCYRYFKSRESATTAVHMVTRVEILQREKKISTVRTEKRTDISLNNVTARIIMGKNERTATRRVAKTRSFGRKNI